MRFPRNFHDKNPPLQTPTSKPSLNKEQEAQSLQRSRRRDSCIHLTIYASSCLLLTIMKYSTTNLLLFLLRSATVASFPIVQSNIKRYVYNLLFDATIQFRVTNESQGGRGSQKGGKNKTGNTVSSSIVFPVQLWDESNVVCDKMNYPSCNPRFLVGRVGPSNKKKSISDDDDNDDDDDTTIPTRTQFSTFDLGNSAQSILLSEGCGGCSNKTCTTNNSTMINCCPVPVPSLNSMECNVQSCWSSRPDEYIPYDAYEYEPSINCSNVHAHDAGYMEYDLGEGHPVVNATVCVQCFGGASHSRYFVNAIAPSIGLFDLQGSSIIHSASNFRFGALIETVPAIDRIWSNMGMGYNSRFLQELGVTAFSMNLYTDGKDSAITFSPKRSTYQTSPYSPFCLQNEMKRVHYGVNFTLTSLTIPDIYSDDCDDLVGSVLFHIDSGNNGIAIGDIGLYSYLELVTGGTWISTDNQTASEYLYYTYMTQEEYPTDNQSDNHVLFGSSAKAPPRDLVLKVRSCCFYFFQVLDFRF